MAKLRKLLFLLVSASGRHLMLPTHAIPEPYPFLHGFNATAAPPNPNSPDPLVRHRWSPSVNRTELQLYSSPPERWSADLPSSFEVQLSPGGGKFDVAVLGPGTLTLDFGVERASWFEFTTSTTGTSRNSSGDDKDLLDYLTCGLSEFDTPLRGKTRRPVRYGGDGGGGPSSFRLETNDELYEGLRYVFINFDPPQPQRPPKDGNGNRQHSRPNDPLFRLENLRTVARIRPANYTASYSTAPPPPSSLSESDYDSTLDKIWYTGAYGVRLNMHPHNFGSVLVERGDRVAIQGDGHPTVAAALTAFGPESYDLVREALLRLDSGCEGCRVVDDTIMAYPIYWTMSVNDYYWTTGDDSTLAKLVPDIRRILDRAADKFWPEDRPNIVWMGWDDRLDDGWCGPCNDEAQRTFASLVVRAYRDFARSLGAAAEASGRRWWESLARQYADAASKLGGMLTADGGWPDEYGLHASASAVNAGLPTPTEAGTLFEREFNDIVRVCSLSPFNQYWILQALGNMPNGNGMDHALSSARLCWGGMTRLGRGCFWETFDPQWETQRVMRTGGKAPTQPSYCHPWSSGVTHWLTEFHVGVMPLKPGYESVLFAPYVSELNDRVSGTLGTPYGTVGVSAKLDGATGEVRLRVESAVEGRVALRMTRDGCVLIGFRRRQDDERALVVPPLSANSMAAQFGSELPIHPYVAASLGFSDVLGPGVGVHELIGVYAGCSETAGLASLESSPSSSSDNPFPPFPPASFPATTSSDTTTRGDWVGKYGSDGYVLFGFDNGTDVQRLPTYVRSLTSYYMSGGGRHEPKRNFRGTSSTNATFLEPPAGVAEEEYPAERALGSIGDECTSCRGLVIDVDIDDSAVHRARRRTSVYTAGTGPSDELAIKAMDFRTRSPIAPMPLVRDFVGGAYWSVEYRGGVRIRVMPRYGVASVSGLFFD